MPLARWLVPLALLLVACEGVAPDRARSDPDPTLPAMRRDALFAHRHESMLARPDRPAIELVFLGDSILRRLETDGRTTWQRYYADRRAANFAVEGDRTQNVLWRIDHGAFDGMHPRVVVVGIGTNNLAENDAAATAAGVEAVVVSVRARVPDARILLLALLPRGRWTPDDPLRRRVEETNARLAAWARTHDVAYADLGAVLLDPDGRIASRWLPDGLHPSAEGYARLAEALEPILVSILARR